ncbi:30S ribosomal protein S4e [Candidatus Woesearchaeota archaeon]|nr:30S ribosomal protein S4e [Candidatus Woesearchaeota archaeon]
MPKQHLKRLATPATWPIKRKGIKFIVRPRPGSRKLELGLPFNIVLKELIGVATTNKEARYVLYDNEVLVDGKRRKDIRFQIGFLDVISLGKDNYRLIINNNGKLDIKSIPAKESKLKIVKINNKKISKKNLTELILSDGRVLRIAKDDKTVYKTGDSLVLEVPEQKISKIIKLEKGSLIFMSGGKHIGSVGIVENVEGKKIFFKNDAGDVFETYKEYALVVGKKTLELDIKK